MKASTKRSVFLSRVKSGSVKRMLSLAKDTHKECGKPTLWIFLDMAYCIARYSIGYQEYRNYGFETTPLKNRKTYMNIHNNIALTRMLVDQSLYPLLNDKGIFMETFSDFIGRDYLDLRKCTKDDFIAFAKSHPVVFCKPCDGFGGIGIDKLVTAEIDDLGKKYDELMANEQYLIDEAIRQHETMNLLCPSCVNTIRMVTIVYEGKPHLIYSIVRMGMGDSVVDNATSGGMYTKVDDTGKLNFPCFCDKTGLTYTRHPMTGFDIIGFQIPQYQQAIDLVLKATMVEPRLGYVGWDVAISENGPVLTEGNTIPGYDMPQSASWNPDRIGMKVKFEEILGTKMPSI